MEDRQGARAHALRFDVIRRAEPVRQGQCGLHGRPQAAYALAVIAHAGRHFAQDDNDMGQPHRIQFGHGDLAHLRARAFELRQHRLIGCAHGRRGMAKPGLIDADRQAGQIGRVPVIQTNGRLLLRVRVAWIGAGDQAISQRHILHGSAQRADVGHAPAERRRAGLTDAAERRFQAHQAAQAGRDSDRTAAIRADSDGAQASGDGYRRPAGAAARVTRRVIRITRRAIMGIGAVGVDANFVHVGLADQQRAGRAQARDGRGVGHGWALRQEGRADRRGIRRLI